MPAHQLCKRPCFHDAYLDAFNVPGTRLIDIDGKEVETIDETGFTKLHPRMGMADVTGTKFEWSQISTAEADWVIIGSIIEPNDDARIAHRFTCRTNGGKSVRVTLDKVIGL